MISYCLHLTKNEAVFLENFPTAILINNIHLINYFIHIFYLIPFKFDLIWHPLII